jgi:hypothetical protein
MSSAGCVVPIRARTFDFFLEFSFGDSERLEQKFNADTVVTILDTFIKLFLSNDIHKVCFNLFLM